MRKPEANKFLLTRIRVLEATSEALLENKTFSSIGDWEAHATVEAMHTQLPVWRRSLERSLEGTGEAVREDMDVESVLTRIEKVSRDLVDNTIGSPDQLLDRFESGLERISEEARNAVIKLRKRYSEDV